MIKSNIQLIAEIKEKSPFGFISPYSFEALLDTALKYGDMISVHTNNKFNGSEQKLIEVKKMTNKPILAKNWHLTDDDVKRALKHADFALVVGRIPSVYLDRCFIEPESIKQLIQFKKMNIPNLKIVWNSRNLNNGRKKVSAFNNARDIWSGWMCQASNIKSIDDVHDSANAVLVGSYLKEFCKNTMFLAFGE
jgi:indole-3-glycerol phosphate synthase